MIFLPAHVQTQSAFVFSHDILVESFSIQWFRLLVDSKLMTIFISLVSLIILDKSCILLSNILNKLCTSCARERPCINIIESDVKIA